MAVDDYGLEVLKKAAEEVTPGSKADYYLKVGVTSDLASIYTGTGQGQNVSVTTSATEALGGASVLADRKGLILYPMDDSDNYLGFASSVTTSNGIPVYKNQFLFLPAGDTAPIYLIRATGTSNVRVWEVK